MIVLGAYYVILLAVVWVSHRFYLPLAWRVSLMGIGVLLLILSLVVGFTGHRMSGFSLFWGVLWLGLAGYALSKVCGTERQRLPNWSSPHVLYHCSGCKASTTLGSTRATSIPSSSTTSTTK